MKNLLLLLLSCIPVWIFGQSTEGQIIYEEKVNLHRRMGPEDESMKAHVPEWQTAKMQLLFTAAESLYKEYEDIEDFQEESGNVSIQIKRSSAEVYSGFEKGIQVTQQEFMGRQFLIERETEQRPWKITTEIKEIQGYPCVKAVFEDEQEKRTVVAWFTSTIPVPAGPGAFGQLPGLILEVDINEGEIVISPQNIAIKELEKGAIKAPSRGKKVSQEEYDQIVAEKMKEMGVEGRGGIRIIRQ